MKNIFKQNRALFLASLFAIIIILTGIIYGISITSYRDYKKKNDLLTNEISKIKLENDSLKSECFVKDITSGRYELIIDKFMEIKKDSLILDSIMSNIE
jgi:hypothetical protein